MRSTTFRARPLRARPIRRLTAALMLMTVVAASCGDDGAGTPDTAATGDIAGATTTAAPKTGGELVLATYSEPASLDPTVIAASGATGGIEVIAIYDTLMRYDPASKKFVPRLAESLTANGDASQWTLVLRPSVTFSDGSPFDATAVKQSIERHVAADSRSVYRTAVAQIASMTVVDARTLTFTLNSPWGGFPIVLATNAGMITNPKAVASLGATFGTNPVGAGAGPFVIDSFRPKEGIRLKRNPTYWAGPANLDAVRFVTLASGNASLDSFKAGNVDAALLSDAELAAQVDKEKIPNWEFVIQGAQILLMNSGLPDANGVVRSPTADPRVRKAVAAAIDLNVVNQRAFNGTGTMSSQLYDKSSQYYADVPGPTYDPAKARQLVAEAKAAGWDGTIRVHCSNIPAQVSMSLAFQAQLEAVGMKVEVINSIDTATLINQVFVKRDFDLVCWAQQSEDALWYFQLLSNYSSASKRFGYTNPAFDAALDEARRATTVDAAKPAYKKMAELIAADVPILPMQAALSQRVVHKPIVHNLDVGGSRGNLYLDTVWIDR